MATLVFDAQTHTRHICDIYDFICATYKCTYLLTYVRTHTVGFLFNWPVCQELPTNHS